MFVVGLVGMGFGQNPSAPTPAEQGATFLWKSLEDNLERRGGGKPMLGRRPFHFIFLIDTAQASVKTSYADYYKNVIRRFLSMVAEAEKAYKHNPPENSVYSIYPYQDDLYIENGHYSNGGDEYPVTKEEPLTPDLPDPLPMPGAQIDHRPDGSPYIGGHLPHVARDQVIESIVPKADDSRTAVMIIFTPFDNEEDITVPGNGHVVIQHDARTYHLPKNDWIAYDIPLQPLKTPAPENDVHIWPYGPQQVTKSKPYVEEGGCREGEPGCGDGGTQDWIIYVVVGLVAAAVGGYFLYKHVGREFDVAIGSETATLTLRRPIEIWGYGADREVNRLVLGIRESQTFGKGHAGTINLSGVAKITPAPLVLMFVEGDPNPTSSADLKDGDPTLVQFKVDQASTQGLKIHVNRRT